MRSASARSSRLRRPFRHGLEITGDEPWCVLVFATRPQFLRDVICAAIRDFELLEFDYEGLHRVVAPYCHGFTSRSEVLRAIQVRGESRSRGMGFGKLWIVDKMLDVRRAGASFTPDDPHYNPNDSAMATIHCRVRR